ncbi:hypothetical protein HZB88_02915 [archaeon]|nr:hypothetical protein [archaeon]
MNRGIAGIAIWDEGEYNPEGKKFRDIMPDFYRLNLEYKLKEYKHHLEAAEIQQEAEYSAGSWSHLNLYSIEGFTHFLLKNRFLALHLRSRRIDITSLDAGLREHSLSETLKGIDFAFKLNADAIVLHPGSYNSFVGGTWEEGIKNLKARKYFFQNAVKIIAKYFAEKVAACEVYKDPLHNKAENNGLLELFAALDNSKDMDYYKYADRIIKFISRHTLEPAAVRKARKISKGIHLCMENVEPFNFLLNTREQHEYWHGLLSEEVRLALENEELFQKYKPYMLLDINHLLNTKFILQHHPDREKLERIIPGLSEIDLPFVMLPGTYMKEPMLNRIIRINEDKILFYHIAGAKKKDNGSLATHEEVRPIRNGLRLEIRDNKIISVYSLEKFNYIQELNMLELFQIIGPDKIYVLEVFNKSPEQIKTSQINASDFLNHLIKLRERYSSNSERVFFQPKEEGGYDYIGLFKFLNYPPWAQIIKEFSVSE